MSRARRRPPVTGPPTISRAELRRHQRWIIGYLVAFVLIACSSLSNALGLAGRLVLATVAIVVLLVGAVHAIWAMYTIRRRRITWF